MRDVGAPGSAGLRRVALSSGPDFRSLSPSRSRFFPPTPSSPGAGAFRLWSVHWGRGSV